MGWSIAQQINYVQLWSDESIFVVDVDPAVC
jgi:hypothetical protein